MDKRFVVAGVSALTPLGHAAPAILRAKAEPLFELEDAAAGGTDMDAVHDMRVASRRLREAMRLLCPVYEKRRFGAWYKRIRGVTRALGPVRDSDVFIDYFTRLESDLSAEGQRSAVFMIGYRTGRREHELDELRNRLARLDLARSRKSFDTMADSVRDSSEARRSLADFAHAAVAERSALVFGLQPTALVEANIQEQHELRIHYKRLRYAVEVFASCYAEDFDDLHDTLTAFQDALGDLHDAYVFLEMVSSPDHVEAATRAGVPVDGIAEVGLTLQARATARFEAFAKLAEAHMAVQMLPRLLLPLSAFRPEPVAFEPQPKPERALETEAKPAAETEPEPEPGPDQVAEEPNEGMAAICPGSSRD